MRDQLDRGYFQHEQFRIIDTTMQHNSADCVLSCNFILFTMSSRNSNLGERLGERFEEIKVEGSQLVDKVKELAREGKVRKISLIKDGQVIAEFPLYLGLGGSVAAVVLIPTIAAVGAIAALVTDITVRIEREASEEIKRSSSGDADDLP